MTNTSFTRFDIEDVLPLYPKVHKWVIVGVRRVGKSFSVEKKLVRQAIMQKKPFVYVARRREDTTGQRVAEAFDHLIENPSGNDVIKQIYDEMKEEYPEGCYFYVYQHSLYLCRRNENAKVERLKRLCYITSIPESQRFKRSTYPRTTDILFDEFISADYYYPRELDSFMRIVTTLAVDGVEPNIWLIGNPDNEIEYCPYLKSYGLSYDDIENNTAIKLDEDTVFVKVTKDANNSIVKKSTAQSFGHSGNVALTGQIERPDVPPVPAYGSDEILAQISIETPVIRINALGRGVYRKQLWADIVLHDGKMFASVSQHKSPADKKCIRIKSLYDTTPFNMDEMYRFDAPTHLQKINNLFINCVKSGRIYYDEPRTKNELSNMIPYIK